jgi:hypothetical protein
MRNANTPQRTLEPSRFSQARIERFLAWIVVWRGGIWTYPDGAVALPDVFRFFTGILTKRTLFLLSNAETFRRATN